MLQPPSPAQLLQLGRAGFPVAAYRVVLGHLALASGHAPPGSLLLSSVQELEAARAVGVPAGLWPFLFEPQEHHADWTCFEPGPVGVAVAVFAVHAVVARWEDVEAWQAWLGVGRPSA